MRNILFLTFGLSGLLCVGFAAFIYQLWAMFNFSDSGSGNLRSATGVFIPAAEDYQSYLDDELSTLEQPMLVDFEVLPNYSHTAGTKRFLEAIYKDGYVGTHDNFQKLLGTLTTKQIVSNMMMRQDEIRYLNTVRITSNMLSMTQIQSCNKLVKGLLADLKSMSGSCMCSNDQIAVINLATNRLTYLTRIYEHELNKFSVTDPLHLQSIDPVSKGLSVNLERLERLEQILKPN